MDLFFGSARADRCEALREVDYVNLTISVVILLGILISYLPQHYKIISKGTPEGLASNFVLLGTISGTCAFANILILPVSRADVACCNVVSPFECMAGLLGIAQVAVQWSCFAIILMLYLVFFPRDSVLPTDDINHPEKGDTWRTAVTVGVLCVVHGLVVIITSVYFVFIRPQSLGTWANILGITAGVLAISQYFPQIRETWRRGHVGSLSIPMMVIQTPGSFVWATSLAVRLGKEGWSSWGIFLVTGCLQGVLLVMGIYFEIQDRKTENTEGEAANGRGCIVGHFGSGQSSTETDDEGNAVVENAPSERTPLIK